MYKIHKNEDYLYDISERDRQIVFILSIKEKHSKSVYNSNRYNRAVAAKAEWFWRSSNELQPGPGYESHDDITVVCSHVDSISHKLRMFAFSNLRIQLYILCL